MSVSRIVKLALSLLLCAALLLLGLLAYLQFGDLNWLKPRIESAVARNSEFHLTLAGDLNLQLFPDPAVLLEGVSLTRDSAEDGVLELSLGHLSGSVQMASLFRGPAILEQLRVNDLSIDRIAGKADVEVNEPEKTRNREPYRGMPFFIDSAELSNIRLRNQAGDGEAITAVLASLSIRELRPGRFSLDGHGEIDGLVHSAVPVPVSADLTAALSAKKVELDDMQLQFADSAISGDLAISFEDHISVSGSLASDRLDLSPLTGTGSDAGQRGEASGSAEQRTTTPRYVFGEQPLPLDILQLGDLDLYIANKELLVGGILLLDVNTGIKLQGSELLLSNSFAGPEGGRASSRLQLDAASSPAALSADIKARDLRLNLVSGDISDKSQIPPMDITIDLASTGNSPRALATSSDGRVLITLGHGQLANNRVGLFIGDFMVQLFDKLNPFASEEKITLLECAIVGMDIAGGSLDFSGMLLQTGKVKAIGDGDIDLSTEELKVAFETQPREGLGISASMFVTPFIGLDGTLAQPRIKVRKRNAVVAGAVAVATGGLSLFAKGMSGRKQGQASECTSLIEKVGGHPPID